MWYKYLQTNATRFDILLVMKHDGSCIQTSSVEEDTLHIDIGGGKDSLITPFTWMHTLAPSLL